MRGKLRPLPIPDHLDRLADRLVISTSLPIVFEEHGEKRVSGELLGEPHTGTAATALDRPERRTTTSHSNCPGIVLDEAPVSQTPGGQGDPADCRPAQQPSSPFSPWSRGQFATACQQGQICILHGARQALRQCLAGGTPIAEVMSAGRGGISAWPSRSGSTDIEHVWVECPHGAVLLTATGGESDPKTPEAVLDKSNRCTRTECIVDEVAWYSSFPFWLPAGDEVKIIEHMRNGPYLQYMQAPPEDALWIEDYRRMTNTDYTKPFDTEDSTATATVVQTNKQADQEAERLLTQLHASGEALTSVDHESDIVARFEAWDAARHTFVRKLLNDIEVAESLRSSVYGQERETRGAEVSALRYNITSLPSHHCQGDQKRPDRDTTAQAADSEAWDAARLVAARELHSAAHDLEAWEAARLVAAHKLLSAMKAAGSASDTLETADVHFFYRPPSPLSQWSPCRFTVDGQWYNCAEQFMMAEKARVFKDHSTRLRILATFDPAEQRRLAGERGTLVGFDHNVWAEECLPVVMAGNFAKFTQNPDLLQQLLATGDRELVEASPFDRRWGIGLDAQTAVAREPTTWPGHNMLGEALMKVRNKLRRQQATRARIEQGLIYEAVAEETTVQAIGKAITLHTAQVTQHQCCRRRRAVRGWRRLTCLQRCAQIQFAICREGIRDTRFCSRSTLLCSLHGRSRDRGTRDLRQLIATHSFAAVPANSPTRLEAGSVLISDSLKSKQPRIAHLVAGVFRSGGTNNNGGAADIEVRTDWFKACLQQIGTFLKADLSDVGTVVLPYGIKSRNSEWPVFRKLIAEFARTHNDVNVIIVRLQAEHTAALANKAQAGYVALDQARESAIAYARATTNPQLAAALEADAHTVHAAIKAGVATGKPPSS